MTSCIARSFDSESESVELESFVHRSPVELKMSIQELKFKQLRPHSLHSSIIVEYIKVLDDPELNKPEARSKDIRPPSLCSGIIVEHDETLDTPELTK